jgi:hypothetical protein
MRPDSGRRCGRPGAGGAGPPPRCALSSPAAIGPGGGGERRGQQGAGCPRGRRGDRRRAAQRGRPAVRPAVDRLAFITTAKSLGLQLPEIRQLLHTWQDGFCAQVQGELGPLLAQRIAQIHERIAELQAFAARLHQAQEQLSSIDRDGPCDPACTFLKATA